MCHRLQRIILSSLTIVWYNWMNLVTKLTKIRICRILMIISCFQKELSPIFKTFRNINSSTSTSSWNQQSLSKFQLGYMGDMNTIPRTSDLNSVSSMNILTFLVFSFLFGSIHSQDDVQRCRGSFDKSKCSGQSNNGTRCQIKDEHGDNTTMTCDGEHKLKQGTLLKNFPNLTCKIE